MPVCRSSDTRRPAALQGHSCEVSWFRRANVVVGVAQRSNQRIESARGARPTRKVHVVQSAERELRSEVLRHERRVVPLTNACGRPTSQSSNLHAQICRLSGGRLMRGVSRQRKLVPILGARYHVTCASSPNAHCGSSGRAVRNTVTRRVPSKPGMQKPRERPGGLLKR